MSSWFAPRPVPSPRPRAGRPPRLEALEARDCPTSFTPAQLQHAYGVDSTALDDGSGTYQIPADGYGQTVAVVVAYDAPNVATDLSTFSSYYGLPAASFTKVRVGSPGPNTNWAAEATMDVELVHTLAPAANIVLFEANSALTSDLVAAVDRARAYAGVSVVSMSWGSGEFSAETGASYQNHFVTPSGHQGVTFVASSGDNGNVSAQPEWPTISPNVVSVGGTSLYFSGADYSYETGWNNSTGGSGGGQSSYFGVPYWQAGYTGLSRRSSPDVALVADPNTGPQFIFSPDSSHTYIYVGGGTSASAPLFAGLMAIVNEQRALLGYGSFDGPNETLPYLYSLTPGYDFNGITTNPNRTGSMITTVGLGSPVAYYFVPDLAYFGIYYDQPPAAGGARPSRAQPADAHPSHAAPALPPPAVAVAPVSDGVVVQSLLAADASFRAAEVFGDVAAAFPGHGKWRSDDVTGW
jgi:subtilase family serine protease